jgi:hypothetical protein
VTAYTFTRRGARCLFTDRIWPCDGGWLPDARATDTDHLPVWIATELWRVELAGRISTPGAQTLGERGRVLDRIDAWDETAAEEFVADCRLRTLTLAARRPGDLRLKPLAEDARRCTTAAAANLAGWLAARTARVLDGEDGRARERVRQADLLRARLGV